MKLSRFSSLGPFLFNRPSARKRIGAHRCKACVMTFFEDARHRRGLVPHLEIDKCGMGGQRCPCLPETPLQHVIEIYLETVVS